MSDDESKIEKLDEKLYSRTRYKAPEDVRKPLESEEYEVGDKWQGPELDEMLNSERRAPYTHPFMKKLFIFALVFFIAALGAAAYIYLGGGNFISSKNVDIEVNGPVSVSAGDVLNLGITVTNTNNADLETANLSITYPDGSRSPLDSSQALANTKTSLGVIGAGQEISTSTSVVLFGQKGEVKDIDISLEYEVKGSIATFSKDKDYQISIGSIPLTLTVDQPTSVTSGQSFTTTLTVLSNSTDVVKGVLVQAQYPYGFAATDSEPPAINQDGNLWDIGDMAAGASKTITIHGVLSGQDEEQRTFRFAAGIGSADDPDTFDTALFSTSDTLSISRPSVGLTLALGGSTASSYVAPAGQAVQGTVSYQNNMTDKLQNAKVTVSFSGTALDKTSVVAQDGGYYDSSSNEIVWDQTSDPSLASLSPGDSGAFSFQFASVPTQANAASTGNEEIDVNGAIGGLDQTGSSVSASQTSAVKIASEVDLSASSVYSIGPMTNSGPIPPQAGTPTTYTVLLDAANTQNDVTQAVVTATLGPGVTWVGSASSSPEIVSYNDTTRQISWNLGTLSSGTGFNSPTREAAFQVSISPSTGQVGSVPTLLNNISLAGEDSFTNTPVSVTAGAVTTKISTDPEYVQGDEQVVQ